MKFKAALFDLDGTLIDSLADLADSANLVLERLGLPRHEPDAYRYFVGEGIRVLATRALPREMRTEEMIDRCTGLVLEVYNQRLLVNTRPYAGIPDLLDGLQAAGLKMAILSNKLEPQTRAIAAELLSSWPFDPICGNRPPVPKKPDPTSALKIASDLGLAPAEILYLGDTSIDMRTATSAGMYAMGVLWGFRPAEELIQGGARALVAHPADLLALL
jgi:phosphoglycolate phosphatase